ncbi:MAG: hypothetical protein ACXW27_13265 [Allosphingosinicella sp.]
MSAGEAAGDKDQPATDIDLRPAWSLGDPAIEADAIAFWRRLAILPADVAPEDRARELVAAAYREKALIGVSTATLGRIESLRGRFAFFRVATDPAHRRSHVAIALAVYTRDLIEQWAEAHPEQGLAGVAVVIENQEIAARLREPYWPVTRLGLVGYMTDGRQIRVAWFRNGRVG